MPLEKILKTTLIISPMVVIGLAVYYSLDEFLKNYQEIKIEEGKIISSLFFGFIAGSPLSYKLLQKFYK